MNSLDQRERYLLGGLTIVFLVAGIWYWILPMYYRYGELKTKITKNVKEIREAQRQSVQLEELVNELKTTKRELKKAKQKLPEKGRFNQLMSTLEQHARNSGIADRKIIEFNRSNVRTIKDGLLKEMTIQTRFRGVTMRQLTDMLWRFDQMTRMVDIKQFQTSGMSVSQELNQIQFDINLTLSVYMLEDQQETSKKGASA
jgi:Tfp pilus assembly protein PilO